jgi:predicted TIM-barrel fold metal-dependent hydrolase
MKFGKSLMETTQTIIDCHVHLWESAAQLGRCGATWRIDSYPSAGKIMSLHDLKVASSAVTKVFLLGFRSKLLGVDIPNKFISNCVYQYRDTIIGFGSIDPTSDNVREEAERLRSEYKLSGIVISPGGQGFHPTSTSAYPLYDYAARHGMPIIIHNGSPFGIPAAEFCNPTLWSPVFREFPEVRFVFTDMGRPWVDATLQMLCDFEHVFLDLAGLVSQTYSGYQLLIKGYQMGVIDRFLMGSDFPSAGSSAMIETIYSINQQVGNTNFPTIPRQKLREIVERDALGLLGLSNQGMKAK